MWWRSKWKWWCEWAWRCERGYWLYRSMGGHSLVSGIACQWWNDATNFISFLSLLNKFINWFLKWLNGALHLLQSNLQYVHWWSIDNSISSGNPTSSGNPLLSCNIILCDNLASCDDIASGDKLLVAVPLWVAIQFLVAIQLRVVEFVCASVGMSEIKKANDKQLARQLQHGCNCLTG